MSNRGVSPFAECNHIEADTRVVLFVIHAISNGQNPILVRTGDTDVVIILIGHCEKFLEINPNIELYVHFFTTSAPSKNKTTKKTPVTGYLDIVKIARFVGLDYCMGLMLLYAYTGSDYTPSFYNIGKTKWFDEFHKRPEVMELFQRVCTHPDTLMESEVIAITRFSLCAYGVEDPDKGLLEGRFDVLVQRAKSFRALPPSPGAAIIQARKAVHIAGHIWGKAHQPMINPPDMCSIMQGWQIIDGVIEHIWTMQPQPSSGIDCFDKCKKKCNCRSTKNLCRGKCSCREHKMSCLMNCKCRRRCKRND